MRLFFTTILLALLVGGWHSNAEKRDAGAERVVELADRALTDEKSDALVAALTNAMTAGLQRRFARVVAAKKSADSSPEASRDYVVAYTDYLRYVERLHAAATADAGPAK